MLFIHVDERVIPRSKSERQNIKSKWRFWNWDVRTLNQNDKFEIRTSEIEIRMACLKLWCLNLKLHLHVGNGNMCGEWLIPCPAPTFAINDRITHKQQHALNDFVLDLVESRDSCNNNNNNSNNNNNNIHSMTWPQWPDLNDLIDPALNDPDIALNHNMPN